MRYTKLNLLAASCSLGISRNLLQALVHTIVRVPTIYSLLRPSKPLLPIVHTPTRVLSNSLVNLCETSRLRAPLAAQKPLGQTNSPRELASASPMQKTRFTLGITPQGKSPHTTVGILSKLFSTLHAIRASYTHVMQKHTSSSWPRGAPLHQGRG